MYICSPLPRSTCTVPQKYKITYRIQFHTYILQQICSNFIINTYHSVMSMFTYQEISLCYNMIMYYQNNRIIAMYYLINSFCINCTLFIFSHFIVHTMIHTQDNCLFSLLLTNTYHTINDMQQKKRYTVCCSYLQIYIHSPIVTPYMISTKIICCQLVHNNLFCLPQTIASSTTLQIFCNIYSYKKTISTAPIIMQTHTNLFFDFCYNLYI